MFHSGHHNYAVTTDTSYYVYHFSLFETVIKLACESQLTEILFKLLIKLACESQLTEILFKLLIKLAWESQLTVIAFKLIIILLRLNF